MFLPSLDIDRKSLVADIVARDYRTAEVFRRHGIGYCCGGKWPVDIACEMHGVNIEVLEQELRDATRSFQVSNQLDFSSWDIDFLVDYIVNVHHRYLRNTAGPVQELLADFMREHLKKFGWLADLQQQLTALLRHLEISMQREEDVLFPYIRQIAHAHEDKESYAALLVRTLRKPVEDTMQRANDQVVRMLGSIRELAGDYAIPANACTSHKVVLAKLRELDNDLSQHYYLEHAVLYPRALAIEKEVLNS